MKLSELIKKLREIEREYGGDIPVYFDTEARTFDYHMAKIDSAYYDEQPEKHVNLHEEGH